MMQNVPLHTLPGPILPQNRKISNTSKSKTLLSVSEPVPGTFLTLCMGCKVQLAGAQPRSPEVLFFNEDWAHISESGVLASGAL